MSLGGVGNGINQPAGNSTIPIALIDEQVLQIADIRRPHIGMEEIVNDAHEIWADPCTKSIETLISLQTFPSELVGRPRQLGAVEGLVTPSEVAAIPRDRPAVRDLLR